MFSANTFNIDPEHPESCLYWIYHEDKHHDPKDSGYIGVSISGAEVRLKSHMKSVRRGSNLHVHNALRKYGDKMKIKVLMLADPETCLFAEFVLRPLPDMGGNILNVAAGGASPSLGVKYSEERCARMREAATGDKNPFFGKEHSEDTKNKISKANKGSKRTEEVKQQMSETRLGKPLELDEVERARRSAAGKAIQSRPDMVAIYAAARSAPRSAETCRKISEALTGLKLSKEHCKARSDKMKDVPWTNPRANPYNWSLSQHFYEMLERGEKQADALRWLKRDWRDSSLSTIFKKLKKGWKPLEDAAFVSWLSEYKQNKEAQDVT